MTDYPNITRARRLRQIANTPEQLAWKALRTLRQQGVTVRRQHSIPPYTVDFAIRSIKLVIEIDGSIHHRADIKANDAKRDAALKSQGWRVLRIDADTALSADALLARVQRELKI
jgi:very-short-patch-repair endonuclease